MVDAITSSLVSALQAPATPQNGSSSSNFLSQAANIESSDEETQTTVLTGTAGQSGTLASNEAFVAVASAGAEASSTDSGPAAINTFDVFETSAGADTSEALEQLGELLDIEV